MILHMHSTHIHNYLLVEFQSWVSIHYKVMDVFALHPGSPSYVSYVQKGRRKHLNKPEVWIYIIVSTLEASAKDYITLASVLVC